MSIRIGGYSLSQIWTIVCAYVRGFWKVRIFEIDTGLYQSGHLDGDKSWQAVVNAGIRGIVDLEGGIDDEKVREHIEWYHYWHIWDGAISGIDLKELKNVAMQIQVHTNAGMRVLVHCQGGVNRSSLVNGQVLRLRGMKGRAIVNHIRSRRPGALTNTDFVKYLEGLV
jgi:hypothetical protein